MREVSRSKSASRLTNVERTVSATRLIREPMVATEAAVPTTRQMKPAAGQFERKSSQKRMYSTISNLVSEVKTDLAQPKPAGVSYLEGGKLVNAALVDHIEPILKSDRPVAPISAKDTTYNSTVARTQLEDFKLPEKKPEGPIKILAPPADYKAEALKKHPFEVLSKSFCNIRGTKARQISDSIDSQRARERG
jgi:hypothetical protein